MKRVEAQSDRGNQVNSIVSNTGKDMCQVPVRLLFGWVLVEHNILMLIGGNKSCLTELILL